MISKMIDPGQFGMTGVFVEDLLHDGDLTHGGAPVVSPPIGVDLDEVVGGKRKNQVLASVITSPQPSPLVERELIIFLTA